MKQSGMKVTTDNVKEVMAALRHATSLDLLVGIPAEKGARKDGPITNAVIGYINETGGDAAQVTPRPHLVPGVAAVADRCADLMAQGLSDALSGKIGATEKGYEKAGLVAQASVRSTITKGEGFKELEESTLAARRRKGFDGTKPLIWTGQYRNSINYVIRGK